MATRMGAFDALLGLQRAVEAAQRSSWLGSSTTGYGTFPPINVFRHGHDFVLVAQLPEEDKESLDVQIKGRQVPVRGAKKVEFADGVSVHLRERRSGAFNRALTIGALKATTASARTSPGKTTASTLISVHESIYSSACE